MNTPVLYTSTGMTSVLMTFAMFAVIFAVVYAIAAIVVGALFARAGEPRWKAWVPVYSTWTFLELGGFAGAWALLLFIPVVGLIAEVIMIIAAYRIGLNLGRSGAFVWVYILLTPLWFLLAAYGRPWQPATYTK